MAIRSQFEDKQQLSALVPGWMTAAVRVALLRDRSDIARILTLVNNAACTCTSMHRYTLCLRPVRLRLTLSSHEQVFKCYKKIFDPM